MIGDTPSDWIVGRDAWTREIMVFSDDGDYPRVVRRWPHVKTQRDAEAFIAARQKAFNEAIFF